MSILSRPLSKKGGNVFQRNTFCQFNIQASLSTDTARIGVSVHLALWQVKGNDWKIAGMNSSCLFQRDVLCSVIFRSIQSLGPIYMYTARWRKFKGSKVSCLRKQCNDKAWIHIYLNHCVSWERSGPGQPKCESCSPKRQAGIQIFFFEPCNCQETKCFMHTCCGSISFLFQILVSISLFYNNNIVCIIWGLKQKKIKF